MEQPAVVLDADAAGGWTVRQVSAAAGQLWGCDLDAAVGQPWDQLKATLPADMLKAVDKLEPGTSLDVGHWQLRLTEIPAVQ
ncbi:MAG TPA: hypothetical protein PK129_13905, partial [Cellvibrionaceae bacterium]|nr:hypothetical protein [Cellvibrionaceae bacterium]